MTEVSVIMSTYKELKISSGDPIESILNRRIKRLSILLF